AVRAVGIVARVLDDAAHRGVTDALAAVQREGDAHAVGQRRLDVVEQLAAHEHARSRLGRGRRTGTGGEARPPAALAIHAAVFPGWLKKVSTRACGKTRSRRAQTTAPSPTRKTLSKRP